MGQFGQLIVERERVGWRGQCGRRVGQGCRLFDPLRFHTQLSAPWLFPAVL